MDGSIGSAVVRRDAAVKAAGTARYAADFAHAGVAYAALTLSPVARGHITSIDTTEAEAAPGVQLVMTHRSLNQGLGEETFVMKGGHMQSSFMPLTSDEIHYAGQIVGLIVADTQEAAEEASRKLRIEFSTVRAFASMDDPGRTAEPYPDVPEDEGDAEATLASSAVKVDNHYATPAQHHNPIELYATTAEWQDDKLTVHVPSQWVIGQRVGLATIFGIPPEDVFVESPYIGGGFGGKATILAHTVLVAAAARRLRRPVKLVVPREAMFTVGSFRPATRSRVALGAERDGTIRALIFEEAGQSAEIDHVAFSGADAVPRMYASQTRKLREATVKTDVNTPGFQRAPGEASSFFGFESAVDELAVALGLDPIELRLKNEPARDPVTGLPWSSRSLVQCYRRGAELFGWARRSPAPGSMRTPDGMLIGWGCATATYPSAMAPASARVTLTPDGLVHVGTAAHDLGTGAYTVLGQVAADVLGIPDARVRVRLGDSSLPSGPVAGGSITTGSAGAAIHGAAHAVRARLLVGATAAGGLFAGTDPASLTLAEGHVIGPDGTSHPLTEVMAKIPGGAIEETLDWKPASMPDDKMRAGLAGGMAFAGPVHETHTAYSFGAQFAEVHIDPLLRTIRLPRMVGVFACGRIINPRTARSNLAGGMVWGASYALHEESRVDRPRARFSNTDLAGYHVSVNADIGEVIVETIHEDDAVVNPIGAKAVGEVGIVGMNAAIANAVFHATGVRVRKTPIMVEDLL
jgi:xanthine dehydrogenase YagR molybdenum-binding subunit